MAGIPLRAGELCRMRGVLLQELAGRLSMRRQSRHARLVGPLCAGEATCEARIGPS